MEIETQIESYTYYLMFLNTGQETLKLKKTRLNTNKIIKHAYYWFRGHN